MWMKWTLLSLVVYLSGCQGAVSEAPPLADKLPKAKTLLELEAMRAQGMLVDKRQASNDLWHELLGEQAFDIVWQHGTERAHTGDLLHNKRAGVYVSVACGLPLFSSEHKYTSGTGWPSFWDVMASDNVVLKTDYSWGMKRTEVLSRCGEHLGHVFQDGPEPTGLRYCINSRALKFVPESEWDAYQDTRQ